MGGARSSSSVIQADGPTGSGILLIGTPGVSTNVLFNAMDPEFHFELVLIEDRVPALDLVRRRIRRLGAVTVVGQLLFQLALVPLLRARSRARREEIMRSAGLDPQPIDPARLRRVRSMNDETTADLIGALAPRVVLVSGTRLLSRRLLRSVLAPLLNTHAGVTPLYRGVHGAYWALACGDDQHCGVSVHLVDAGMDTGPLLAWTTVAPDPRDDFTTYPLLQLAAALPLMREQLRLALAGRLSAIAPPPGLSRAWSHPTLWGYLWRWARNGVR